MSLPTRHPLGDVLDERGYTLIELLVAMVVGLVITMAGFALLQFTTEDVSHITDRVHVDQVGRTALERIILELHSTCVSENVVPLLENSNGSVVDFVSEAGTGSALTTVDKHEIIYTPATGTSEGSLIEKVYPSTGSTKNENGTETYAWSSTATTTKLLTGVRETKYGAETTPLFRYYRYYKEGDVVPAHHSTIPFGEIDETPMGTPITKATAEEVTKVTVSFTLAPEGKESATFNQDRPVVLEDSVILRLTPSSEASGTQNGPCSEKI